MELLNTKGSIKSLFLGEEVDEPIFQILQCKQILSSNGPTRYRAQISDGQYSTASCMLHTGLNDRISSEEFNRFAIVKVTRYTVSKICDTRTIIILIDLDVLADGDCIKETLGNPINFELNDDSNTARNGVAVENQRTPIKATSSSSSVKQFAESPRPSPEKKKSVFPISSLTPYQNRWTIQARVTSKSEIKNWSNSRGEGKLFSVNLIDESGEIRATGFNAECDKFYDILQEGKVYNIGCANVKVANKKFSNLNSEYEITFNSGSTVSLCGENVSLPTMKFNFIKIRNLENFQNDSTVDILGVCISYEGTSIVLSKSTGRELIKRDIQLIDDSLCQVRLTLWGNQAEKFDGSLNPVIALKGVKVSEFGGRSLSALSSTTIQINPDIREVAELKSWYINYGQKSNLKSLSEGNFNVSDFSANLKTIREAMADSRGELDYYSTKACITMLNPESCMYRACPGDGCSKKLIDLGNDCYKCEKCNRQFDNFNWRYIIRASISDATDSVLVTFFNEQAEALLGHTANQMAELSEKESEAAFKKHLFKVFIFKLRVKLETFNDQSRLKTTVVTVVPIDFVEANKKLLSDIATLQREV